MIAKGRCRSIIPLLAGIAVVTAGGLLTHHTHRTPPRDDVRYIVAAYLANEEAAREEYRDALVTASGVVNWSAQREEITTRLVSQNDGKQPAHHDDIPDEACVLIIVPGGHQILADFAGENKLEALALRSGDRVTIRGRHTGSWFGGAVYRHETVYLTLVDCKLVR
jgi:hypothetical protein